MIYGKFEDFEIRDIEKFTGHDDEGNVITETLNAVETGVYDLVKHASPDYCYSIARLIWDKKDEYFKLETIHLRFLQDTTPELNWWLTKWCELREYELTHDNTIGEV